MKHGNVNIRNGLALLLCNMALFCSVGRAASLSGKTYSYGSTTAYVVWNVNASTFVDGTVFKCSYDYSAQSFGGASYNIAAGTSIYVYLPNGSTGQTGIRLTQYPIAAVSGTLVFDLKGQSAGWYSYKFSNAKVIGVIYWDGTEITEPEVTGKITGFRDGKWWATVTAKNIKSKVDVFFYQVGWVTSTLQIVAPGENEMSLEPLAVQQSYTLKLNNETFGVVLDQLEVPYAPLKVSVIANLNITNPGGVTDEEVFVRVNGVSRTPGNKSLVEPFQLGEFEPGESIPVVFGSGITGKGFIYTVPNKRGETVSFDVVGVVKDPGGPTDPTDPSDPTDPGDPPKPSDGDGGGDPGKPSVPVVPGDPTDPGGGGEVVDAIKNLEKTAIAEGTKARTLSADGFNKVLDQIYNGTVKNVEELDKVVKAVKDNEYAVRDEAYKTRVFNGNEFSRLISAINAGNAGVINAIGENGFDDGRMVAATNEVRDEVKKINDRFDEAEGKMEQTDTSIKGQEGVVRQAGDRLSSDLGGVLGSAGISFSTQGSVEGIEPYDSVRVGRHEISFNPLNNPTMARLLRGLRNLVAWSIAAGFFLEISMRINNMISDINKTGKHVSSAGIIVAPTLGGTAGPVAGAALMVFGVALILAAILTAPVILLAILSTMESHFQFKTLIMQSPVGMLQEMGSSDLQISKAIWYANQVIPLAMCLVAPVYRIILIYVIMPSQAFLQTFIRVLPI